MLEPMLVFVAVLLESVAVVKAVDVAVVVVLILKFLWLVSVAWSLRVIGDV